MSTKSIAGSSRTRWRRLFDDSTATTALAIPLPSNTAPTGTGLLNTGEFPLARFMISGTIATGTINYQIIGRQRFSQTGGTGEPTAWIPRVLASGVATLGTAAVTATWIGTATDVFAHTITETIGATGSVVFSPGGNGIAWIEVDCSNCELLEVETDLGTATAASVQYQLGERVGGVNDIDASIAGTGLATAEGQVLISGPIGITTDSPVADNTTVESGTARTGISLWKRIVNVLIAVLAKLPALGTAGTASADVITVQGIASGVAQPVSGTVAVSNTEFPLPAATVTTLTPPAAITGFATEVSLAKVAGAVPGIGTPQAALTTAGAGWMATEGAIPAGTTYVDFILDQPAYVVADATADDPAQNGVFYPANLVYRLPAKGCTKLHLKRQGGTDSIISWTTFAAAT